MERTRSAIVGAATLALILAAIGAGARRRAARADASRPPLPPPASAASAPLAPPGPSGAKAQLADLDTLLADLDAGPRPRPRELPAGAPKSVRFGVILVRYRGAEDAPAGARTRREALDLARELAAAGRADFRAAVARGDEGSIANAGRIARGVLEPDVEWALFTLAPGEVGEPVDTPRGYWIPRRIE
jgi:hypothetical protein